MKHRQRNERKKTVLEHVLLGLVPYTRQNFALSFKPNAFFNELEQISGYSRTTLRAAFYRAKRIGYIQQTNDDLQLTKEGERVILPFQATRLGNDARLLVMFDIPQRRASSRQTFRRTLKKLGFWREQQSVWVTDMDYRNELVTTIQELDIEPFVEIHESVKLYPL